MGRKVVVIGGGAAGFFFAINAGINNPDDKIIILEQGKQVLGKVRVSGGGRCNVTHACFDPKELIAYYPRGSKELLGPFHKFCTGDTMAWFEDRGLELKIESDGRIFPVTDSSQSIIDCFETEIARLGIRVHTSIKVTSVNFKTKTITCSNRSTYGYDVLFLGTGSSRSFWKLIKSKGIEVVDPVPSLFTFHVNDPRIKDLQGIAMNEVSLISDNGSYVSKGPLLITHWGFSAPSVLKLSAFEARRMAEVNYNFKIIIDFLPHYSEEEIVVLGRNQGGKLLSDKNPYDISRRYWIRMLEYLHIDKNIRWADIKKDKMELLTAELKSATFQVKGKSTFKEEFVSAGGIDLKEVDFRTFKLKKMEGVYVAGEILNIDAVTGGFNFQAAWTGAFLAAKNI